MKRYIIPLAFILSCIFCFVVFPKISGPYHAVLDSDKWGKLGQGVYHYHTFSYYPETEPTLNRSPIYPMLISALLWLTDGGLYWPYSLQLFQCILFSLTCFLVYWIAENLFNERIAVISSLLCAIYPFLIWFTSRILIESSIAFLFTCFIASIIYFTKKPNYQRSALIGIVLALNILNKQTFLPFLFILPVLLYKFKKKAIIIPIISLILIMPWTYRNYKITHEIIPVHLLAGYNLQLGDGMLRHYKENPFSFAALWDAGYNEGVKPLKDSLSNMSLQNWERELILDKVLIKNSLSLYKKEPLFLIKKMLLNSYLFWTLGETKLKTLVISCMQVPILILFLISAIKIIKKDYLSEKTIPIYLILSYWFFHFPIMPTARFAIPLISIMLIYASIPIKSLFDYLYLPRS